MKKILIIIALTFLIFQMVVLATAIDIGSPAIDRSTNRVGGYTYVNQTNPANETGTITSIEIWATLVSMVDCEVATFYVVSGNNLSTRDTEYIGAVAAGSKQTFEVNLDVQEGDYIGYYESTGRIEADGTGYAGMWYKGGDQIPCTDTLFNVYSGDTCSLYGIGTTEAPPEEENAIFFGTNF